MPLILLLPYFPLATVLVGMFVVTSVKCTEFECVDIVHDCLDCDVVWCYENGGCACCCCSCCTGCHDSDAEEPLYDDDALRAYAYAYAKKS